MESIAKDRSERALIRRAKILSNREDRINRIFGTQSSSSSPQQSFLTTSLSNRESNPSSASSKQDDVSSKVSTDFFCVLKNIHFNLF